MLSFNQVLLKALGLKQGVSHTEFIKSRRSGEFYFLETSARVGGAHIVDLVDAASGLNLWAEWARLECRRDDDPYVVTAPKRRVISCTSTASGLAGLNARLPGCGRRLAGPP